jgi:organic hydroperoxide reductase OsmC/OhrA
MSGLEREATIRWLTNPPEGQPRMTVGSGSVSLPLSVDPNATHPLATSPAELLAGAIGSIFAWFAARELMDDGTQAHELVVYVTLTVSDDLGGVTDLALSRLGCKLLGRVPDVDGERLEAVAKLAMSRCFDTLALRSDRVEVTVEATLEGP